MKMYRLQGIFYYSDVPRSDLKQERMVKIAYNIISLICSLPKIALQPLLSKTTHQILKDYSNLISSNVIISHPFQLTNQKPSRCSIQDLA